MRGAKTYKQAWIFGALIIGAIVVALFFAFTSMFERNAPKVNVASVIVWNVKTPFYLSISDNSGVKEYKISVIDGSKMTTIANETLSSPKKQVDLNVTYPNDAFIPSQNAYVSIHVRDASLWNWFKGNETDLKVPLIADIAPPQVKILAASQAIYRGGSATVIFRAVDDTKVVATWLETASGEKFMTQPTDVNNTYAAIVAWDIKSPKFALFVCAKDLAGNVAKIPVSILAKDLAYKTSVIKLSPEAIDQKMAGMCVNVPNIKTPIECFSYVNNKLRAENEAVIAKVTQRVGSSDISGFFTEPFLPITKAQVVGTYGDHRIFEVNGQPISESYHLGIDFASVKEANVVAPNNGVVLFAKPNGIYGNMLIIYHGLGMSTLYGHCSSFMVKEGDLVTKGQLIAKTGSTGLALGDHLHYGVIIQGIAVRPVEWLDARWIKNNVTAQFQLAKDGR